MTERKEIETNQIDDVTNTEAKEGHVQPHASENPEAQIGEFKITVRKLEMPVRPRGVLAE